MIRTLNFACLFITGLVCLALYRSAEEARVATADLKAARASIVHEKEALVVLGAEWARVTQPARIQALVQRHLDLTDKPAVQLSSLSLLPRRNEIPPQAMIRTAKASVQARPTPAVLVRQASGL